MNNTISKYFFFFLFIFMFLISSSFSSAETTLQCKFEQSTNIPIVFTYSIHNKSEKDYHFMSLAGSSVPLARYFRAEVLSVGELHYYFIGNDYYLDLAGHLRKCVIHPGEKLSFYFVLTRLKSGKYMDSIYFHKKHWSFPKGIYSIRISYVGPTYKKGLHHYLPLNTTEWIDLKVTEDHDIMSKRNHEISLKADISKFIKNYIFTDAKARETVSQLRNCEPNDMSALVSSLISHSYISPKLANTLIEIYSSRKSELKPHDRILLTRLILQLFAKSNTEKVAKRLIEISETTSNQAENETILFNLSSFHYKCSINHLISKLDNENREVALKAASALCKMRLLDGLDMMFDLANEGERLEYAIYYILMLRKTEKGKSALKSLAMSNKPGLSKKVREIINKYKEEAKDDSK